MDDWQDAALSTRHMHNRVGRNGGRSGRGKTHGGSFDVRKSFGSYSCKCAAWDRVKTLNSLVSSSEPAVLELFRLTTDGQGVVGELALPGALRASVILAASRKSLGAIISRLDSEAAKDGDDNDDEEEKQQTTAKDKGYPEEEQDDEGENSEISLEEIAQDRFETFEKNSFRSPKFWLQWSGAPATRGTDSAESANIETGLGYIVFAGNDCRKFSGTINCAVLGWKDVSITGHKIASRSESDVPVIWTSNRAPL